MKNKTIFVSVLIMSMMLAGCNTAGVSDTTQKTEPAKNTEEIATTTPTPTPTPEPTEEPAQLIAFAGEYEETITGDNGDVIFAYNLPIEEDLEVRVEGKKSITMEYVADESSIICSVTYYKRTDKNDREKELQEYIDKPKTEERVITIQHDDVMEEGTETYSIIANKLDDIVTDIGEFSYYRVYEASGSARFDNKRFTEEAFINTGDYVLHARKASGDPNKLYAKHADETLVEMLKVAFNDVSYKNKLVADNSYDPKLSYVAISGIDDTSDDKVTEDTTDVVAADEVQMEVQKDQNVKTENDEKTTTTDKYLNKKTEAKEVASLSGSFFYSCTDMDGVTWSITGNSSKPVEGTTVKWSGVYPGCYNAIAPLNANGSINYGAQVKNVNSFTLTGAFAQNGVIMWINAWESDGDGGMDAAVKWYPDGHYEG